MLAYIDDIIEAHTTPPCTDPTCWRFRDEWVGRHVHRRYRAPSCGNVVDELEHPVVQCLRSQIFVICPAYERPVPS